MIMVGSLWFTSQCPAFAYYCTWWLHKYYKRRMPMMWVVRSSTLPTISSCLGRRGGGRGANEGNAHPQSNTIPGWWPWARVSAINNKWSDDCWFRAFNLQTMYVALAFTLVIVTRVCWLNNLMIMCTMPGVRVHPISIPDSDPLGSTMGKTA